MASKKHLQTVEEKATKTQANQPPLPTTEVQPGKARGRSKSMPSPLTYSRRICRSAAVVRAAVRDHV